MATPRRSPGRREAGLQGCEAAAGGARGGRAGFLPGLGNSAASCSARKSIRPDPEPAQAQAGLKTMRLAVRTRAPRPRGASAEGLEVHLPQGRAGNKLEVSGELRTAPPLTTGKPDTWVREACKPEPGPGPGGDLTGLPLPTAWLPATPAATGPAWSPPKQGQAGLLGSCEGISAPGEAPPHAALADTVSPVHRPHD